MLATSIVKRTIIYSLVTIACNKIVIQLSENWRQRKPYAGHYLSIMIIIIIIKTMTYVIRKVIVNKAQCVPE